MTVGFLCSMFVPEVDVFLEEDGHHTIYTTAGRLIDSNRHVKDFRAMQSGAFLILAEGVEK